MDNGVHTIMREALSNIGRGSRLEHSRQLEYSIESQGLSAKQQK